MERNHILRKSLAIGIILLFIGVEVVPSINFTVVKASNDNSLVEVTTQACGINGFGNTTVKLTREQCQNLEQYLVDFRARLNQTTTRDEAVPIFKEAVVELNKYGLLPKGMSVQKAEKLVTGEYLNKKMMNALELFAKKNMVSNRTNYLCLTVGWVINGWLITPLYLASVPFGYLWFWILFNTNPDPDSLLGFFIYGVALSCRILQIIVLSLATFYPFSMVLFAIFDSCKNLFTIGTSGLRPFYDNGEGILIGYIGLKISFIWPANPGIFSASYLLGFSLAAHT